MLTLSKKSIQHSFVNTLINVLFKKNTPWHTLVMHKRNNRKNNIKNNQEGFAHAMIVIAVVVVALIVVIGVIVVRNNKKTNDKNSITNKTSQTTKDNNSTKTSESKASPLAAQSTFVSSPAASKPATSSSGSTGSTTPTTNPTPAATPTTALTALVTSLKSGQNGQVTSTSVTVSGPITDATARPLVFSVNGTVYFAYKQGSSPNFTQTVSQIVDSMAIVKGSISGISLSNARVDKVGNLVDENSNTVGFSTGGN